MPERIRLTDKQQALLRWIAAGCPEGVMPDDSHRISAAALRNRGLATTSGRGPSWTARITPAGLAHLESLDRTGVGDRRDGDRGLPGLAGKPANPGRRSPRSGPPAPLGETPVPLGETPVPLGETPVPLGETPVPFGETPVPLGETPVPLGETSVPLGETPVPSRHPVARDFHDRIERHEVSRRQLERATELVQTLAGELERRGWRVATATESENELGLIDWSSAKDGHLTVDVGEQRFWLRLQEEGVGTRGALEDDEDAVYDRDGTGRLKLELRWGEWFTRQQSRWLDRPSEPLEDRLDAVYREIQERAAESLRLAEEKRALAARAAAQERAQAEARERQWEQHMARARERYFRAGRVEALHGQVDAWDRAARVRAYCEALAAAHPEDAEVADWVAWARAYADELDPVRPGPAGGATSARARPRMPVIEEPAPAALQPYMPEGWSTSGP